MNQPNNRPRERDLYLVVTRNSDDPCDISYELVGDLVFENNHRPGFMVFIDIDAHEDLGAKFLSSDPMWVQPFSEETETACTTAGARLCPTSPSYWDQFATVSVINRGRTLLVRNKNDYEQSFAFTLRFQVKNCPRVFELDPIGSNQNGQQQ